MGITKAPKVPSYASVMSSNPYATAIVNSMGSLYTLNPFLTQQNKTIEQTVPQLFQRLANPTLDDPISFARRQAFEKAFNSQAKTSFENNLINPLSKRRMLRSSLVNDLSNNLQTNQTSQIADFNNQLLANSLNDTQSLINFYMNHYKNNASYGNNTLAAAKDDAASVNAHNYRAYGYDLNNQNSSSSAITNILGSSQMGDLIGRAIKNKNTQDVMKLALQVVPLFL